MMKLMVEEFSFWTQVNADYQGFRIPNLGIQEFLNPSIAHSQILFRVYL